MLALTDIHIGFVYYGYATTLQMFVHTEFGETYEQRMNNFLLKKSEHIIKFSYNYIELVIMMRIK